MAREKEHRQGVVRSGERRLQVQAADFGHLQIDHHTTRLVDFALGEEFGRRPVRPHGVAAGSQQPRHRHQERLIVIDDVDDWLGRVHPQAADAAIGRVMRRSAPPSALFCAQSRPPCASTMVREIDNPMPTPLAFVLKNGSKMRSS